MILTVEPKVKKAFVDILREIQKERQINLVSKNAVSIDEVIEHLRKQYNIVIYNDVEPFVDPLHEGHIVYQYSSKWCNLRDGWNGRVYIARKIFNHNPNLAKFQIVEETIKWMINNKEIWNPNKN